MPVRLLKQLIVHLLSSPGTDSQTSPRGPRYEPQRESKSLCPRLESLSLHEAKASVLFLFTCYGPPPGPRCSQLTLQTLRVPHKPLSCVVECRLSAP